MSPGTGPTTSIPSPTKLLEDGRRYIDIVAAKNAALARMWIERSNRNARRADTELDEGLMREGDNALQALGRRLDWDLLKRNVGCDVTDPEILMCKHHHRTGTACQMRQQFRVSGIVMTPQDAKLLC